ncbi:MAG: (2Fe-2S)-binding protein [bacterium]|nr:(2Fe-2S)-binding protein [bacterium]
MNLAMDKYIKIRGAQAQGARTVEELEEMTDIVIENEDELKEVEAVLKNVCKCKGVSVEEVVTAVKNGADTIEKVAEATKATTVCGRCKGIVGNIIENKR